MQTLITGTTHLLTLNQAAAAILTIAVGWFADKTNQRGFCNMGISLLGIIGFSMLLGSDKAGVKYAGVFFGALGIVSCAR